MKRVITKAKELPYEKKIGYLIAIATTIRLIVAAIMELSIDEVYYWTYALYPDLSHFDHPPMVGLVIKLFTFNLTYESEFFIRLGSVAMSAFNTFMMYKIGARIRNEQTGFFAALLYTASIYASVLAGTFILPDSPQLFFWLISLWFLLRVIEKDPRDQNVWWLFIAAGFAAALAIMSKYHSVFILFGFGLYVLFFDRKWLRHPALYISMIIGLSGLLPILFWNLGNDFISFTFHSDRVTPQLTITPEYFFREIGGQIAYNNPVNFFMIVTAIVGFYKGRQFLPRKVVWFFLLSGLPLIMVFTAFSLFRATLPHWSGPGYLPLLFIAAAYLSARYEDKETGKEWAGTPSGLKFSNYLILFLLVAAVWLINYSPLQLGNKSSVEKFGEFDFTQDMYGWGQIGEGFEELQVKNDLPEQDFIAKRYFPGSHIHYYVSHPLKKKMFMTGNLNEVHKYAWINREEGGLKPGASYYHIATSNYYWDPVPHFEQYFEEVVPIDTIEVTRAHKTMRYAFVYDCRRYNGNYQNPLQ